MSVFIAKHMKKISILQVQVPGIVNSRLGAWCRYIFGTPLNTIITFYSRATPVNPFGSGSLYSVSSFWGYIVPTPRVCFASLPPPHTLCASLQSPISSSTQFKLGIISPDLVSSNSLVPRISILIKYYPPFWFQLLSLLFKLALKLVSPGPNLH